MKGPLYLCADIGGTQIKTGLLDGAGRLVGAIHREDAQAGLPQQPLLDHIAACLLAPWPGDASVAGVCLAMPGPCDYPAGRCWIEGLEKYGSLYGADLRRELGARLVPALGPAGENLLFQNDVAAFALGELRCGCAQGIQRGLFVCIGTGCGSAFTVGDALAPEGTPGVPPQGYLYPLPLAGKRVDDWLSRRGLLVWNGEHYNLGNVLGLTPDRHTNGMTANFFGDVPAPESDVEALHQSVESYLTLCEENGYPYDFILASVSGLFHDNAPPNLEILHRIEAYNQRYPQGVQLRMVSLQELYSAIREPLADSPVYRGDLTDWWANGVGSTPYAVKHYREAQRRYALARRLEPPAGGEEPGPLPRRRGQPGALRRAHLGPLLHHHQPLRYHGAQPGRPQEQLRLQGPRGRLPAAGPDRRGEGGYPPLLQHQLPGTCMEYSMSDDGLAYVCPQGSALIASYDVPLFYFGEIAHHPIRLCDNREENNRRPVYSWVMNNTWETNFKMDLFGFGEYRYTLWLSGETDPQRAMEELRERCFEPWPLITG